MALLQLSSVSLQINTNKCFLVLCLTSLNLSIIFAQNSTQADKGIDNFTPSKSIYFDWINRNWFGSNEKKGGGEPEVFQMAL